MMNLQKVLLAATASLLLSPFAYGQAALTDIGATNPVPGALDISQLSNAGTGSTPGLNFYWDNGVATPQQPNPQFPAQSFTTLANPQGYTLTSLAIKTDGAGGGSGPLQSQSFELAIYQLSGTGLTNALLVASYTATGELNAEGDWLLWTNIGVPLEPNTTYAYGFGIAAVPGDGDDWERLSSATNLPYTGGQVCSIPDAGGLVTYSSTPNKIDATFDIGLALPAGPNAVTPLVSPSYATSQGVTPGQNVTLTASAAGSQPITYQWQTDGGTGGALANIDGATGTNLVVNTSGLAVGTYVYDFVASNSIGVSTSATVSILIVGLSLQDIGAAAPTPGALDIAQLASTKNLVNPDGFNYFTDNGANHDTWCGQTFTTGNNSAGYVMSYLAWKSDGNGSGDFGTSHVYDLFIYSVSGSTATLITSYQVSGAGLEFDWFQFNGLNVQLAPNTTYAYAFGRDVAAGWENIAATSGNPYSGGQICTIPEEGGTIVFGPTGGFDATFDIGLNLSTLPGAFLPTVTPNINPIYAGTSVTLNETGIGAGTLSYQWLSDNGTGTFTPVANATGSNLVVNTTGLEANNYQYEVVVSNTSGSVTSAPVSLTIAAASAPIIVTDTTPNPNNEGYIGQVVSFSASFAGTQPITYQWMVSKGGGAATAISGSSNPTALTSTLVLSNLQSSDAGVYTVIAHNSVSSTTSTPSTLIVLSAPSAPTAGTYGALVTSQNPLAFWRLNETGDPSSGILPAFDASGHNLDGVYGSSAQDAFNGVSGPTSTAGFPGFESTNGALMTSAGTPTSTVTVPPLNLNTNTATITMWINPNGNEARNTGLFMYRSADGRDAAGLSLGGAQNASGMAALGYTWNSNNAATVNFNSGLYPLPNQWSFVALVIEPTNATLYLYYIDPTTLQPDLFSASNGVANSSESFYFGTNEIGGDPFDVAFNRTFGGDIDDVAVYNTAMSGDQILALFSKAAGLGPVVASITVPPQSQQVLPGHSVTFSASGIDGTSPFTFQWQHNSNNIPNATNLSITIASPTSNDAGTYTLLVKNPVGTTSVSATLTVLSPVGLLNWAAPVHLTTADATLELPGTVVGAAVFGGTAETVTLGNGSMINFTSDGSVATTTGAVSLTGPAFFGGDTGNKNFNAALDQAEVDAGPHMIVLQNLTVGQAYTVQLFGLDDRLGGASTRTAAYEDGDNTSVVSATFAMGDDVYVIGTFTATNTTKTIIENLTTGNGNINALVMRDAAAPSVTVSATLTGGNNLTITWPQGILLESTNVLGPWTTNSLASSPFMVNTTNGPQMYFKVKVQ